MVDKRLIEQNWDSIKKNIKIDNDATGIARKIWIEPLLFNDCSDNVLTILVPSSNKNTNTDIQLGYIKDHYTGCFQDALCSLFDEKIEVRFIPGDPKEETITGDGEKVSSFLNPKYRFENFIVDGNNNVAHSASLFVAESAGKKFNPLFIYGGTGIGKTHLLTAIGHYIIENSNKKVLYVTAEQFSNDVITSICAGEDDSSIYSSMTLLRKKYRDVDVLLMDNIEYIANKKTTQEEFLHTLNTRIDSEKSIVMASDRHPSLMKGLSDILSSRFMSGFLIDIQPPSFETRVAILKSYADILGSTISDEIIYYIAQNIRSDVRKLEGAFNQVYVRTKIGPLSENMDLGNAKEILKDTINLSEINCK